VVYPAWLGQLTHRDESLRRHHGLFPARDGWYKTVNLKKRYIAKPMPLADVVTLLPARLAEITGQVEERPVKLGAGSTTIEQLAEIFIAHLWQRHQTGQPRKLSRRTYDDYCATLELFVTTVGETQPAIAAGPTWFTRFARVIAKRAATTRRRHAIYLIAFFNWAGPGRHALNFYKTPVNFGPDFVKPSEDQIRAELDDADVLYTPQAFAEALGSVVDCPLLYAAGLLGLNCGYLPSDLVSLPEAEVNLDAEDPILRFPRPKTNIERLNPLMPETVAALRAYLKIRPKPSTAGEGLFFINEYGEPFNTRRYTGQDKPGVHSNTIGAYWRQVTGKPFKGLRTTLATQADSANDDRAVDLILGHAAKTIRQKNYVKQFEASRCRAVIERFWPLFVAEAPPLSGASKPASELARAARLAAERSAMPSTHPDQSGSVEPETPAKTRRVRPARRLESAGARS